MAVIEGHLTSWKRVAARDSKLAGLGSRNVRSEISPHSPLICLIQLTKALIQKLLLRLDDVMINNHAVYSGDYYVRIQCMQHRGDR